MIKISVIIATRNRADALETISLPSLVKQDFKDFEVIIWDASNDDKSKIVVEKYIQSHPDMVIRYFKAPRVGSASQRNDAVKVAKGEIVFFIDDDSEVSPDGISTLIEVFEDKSVFGAGLPLKNSGNKQILPFRKLLSRLYDLIFRLPHGSKKRKVMLSGWNIWPSNNDNPGKAEWLSGCSMGFRKTVFDKISFNEELQKFGGYALGEDVEFSHRLFRNKIKIVISQKGYIIHREAKDGRLENERIFAAQIYNHFIIWRTAIFPYNKLSIFVYLWSLFGELLRNYINGVFKSNKKRIKGTSMGIKAIIKH